MVEMKMRSTTQSDLSTSLKSIASDAGIVLLALDLDGNGKIDLEELLVVQNQILEQAIKCLKPGGRLLYSTCSIDPEENIDLVTQFLKRHPTFSLEKSDQLLPFKDQSDGAFAALLRQNSSS